MKKQNPTALEIRLRLNAAAQKHPDLFTRERMTDYLTQIFGVSFNKHQCAINRIDPLVTKGIITSCVINGNQYFSFTSILPIQDQTIQIQNYLNWRKEEYRKGYVNRKRREQEKLNTKVSFWSRMKGFLK